MKIRALVTKGEFVKGMEYDLPEPEAQAAIIAGNAESLVTNPCFERQTATKPQYQTRWRTR
jgi:hypothetical protein